MSERAPWTFLSNHGHVLMCLAVDPDARLRDIAERVGITERTAFGIVENLQEAGIVMREKVGRRNTYRIDRSAHLRHRIESSHTVGELIDLLGGPRTLGDLPRA
ncbi:MAG: MarR family transcriptional regulator [Actinobacteria bacterium]|nr:MarR family transcriptional regulator [Actinomycetota bacterium]